MGLRGTPRISGLRTLPSRTDRKRRYYSLPIPSSCWVPGALLPGQASMRRISPLPDGGSAVGDLDLLRREPGVWASDQSASALRRLFHAHVLAASTTAGRGNAIIGGEFSISAPARTHGARRPAAGQEAELVVADAQIQAVAPRASWKRIGTSAPLLPTMQINRRHGTFHPGRPWRAVPTGRAAKLGGRVGKIS